MKKLTLRDRENGLNIIDLIILSIAALLCFFFFCQGDLTVTARHSLMYLKGHISDFYSACHELNGLYAANYMPSTFIIYAVWNLPMLLLGKIPDTWDYSSVWFTMWNKLLPVLIFVVCALLMYKLCKDRLCFSAGKSRLAMYLFISSPIAIFSQLVFSQYDIFTVFFILLGLYYYFSNENSRKHMLLFSLYFGIAITFKYFALLFFAVLLLLKYKNIKPIFISSFVAVFPLVLQAGFYLLLDRSAFMSSVLSFNVLGYAGDSQLNIGMMTIKLAPLAFVLLLALSYFMKSENKDQHIKNVVFLCMGVCFVIFGFMKWHPQWFMIMVPFTVLSLMLTDKFDIGICLDIILFAAIMIFTVNYFTDNVDQSMLKFGVLSPDLMYKANETNLKMADLLLINDTGLLGTGIFALLLVNFAVSHPRFCKRDVVSDIDRSSFTFIKLSSGNLVRIRFASFLIVVLIPMFLCLPSLYEQSDILWRKTTDNSISQDSLILDSKNSTVDQMSTVMDDRIDLIKVRTVCESESISGDALVLEIIDPEEDKVLGEFSVDSSSVASDGQTSFSINGLSVKKGKQYDLRFSIASSSSSTYAVSLSSVQPMSENYIENSVLRTYGNDVLYCNGVLLKNSFLIMEIQG